MKALCFFVVFVAVCPRAFGWGVLGHEAMSRVAQRLLSNDVAQTVQRILGTNEMAAVALWADHLRDAQRLRGPLRADPDAREFNRRFPENARWHYVNLPLGSPRYASSSPFTSSNDIVQVIDRCVAVLEGRGSEMSKTHALRWLVHLVGDLHQPLHVGCGYYAVKPDGEVRLLREPGEAEGHPHDLGGNVLRFSASRNLHGYWDVGLVELIDNSAGDARLEAMLAEALEPERWKTEGSPQRWAEHWAADAVTEARAAYEGIEFENAQLGADGGLTNVVITLPQGYQAQQTERAKKQLSKAAFHLSEILNRLSWESE